MSNANSSYLSLREKCSHDPRDPTGYTEPMGDTVPSDETDQSGDFIETKHY